MIKTKTSNIRTIKPGHNQWMITDGLIVTARAGFEIKTTCPASYKTVLMECIDNGWLQPVAHMTEREMMISGLLTDE